MQEYSGEENIGDPFADVPMNGVVVIAPQPAIEYKEFSDAKSLRSHIYQVADIKEEMVDVPEWQTRILVKGLTGKQRAGVMQACVNADMTTPDIGKMYVLMVINGVRHPATKEFIFSAADRDSLMAQKSGGVIERLALAVMRVSGLETGAQDTLKKT